MEAGLSLARQARVQHRHELDTLTYVTLDQANGGIVRNLNHGGIGVQAVAAVRPHQPIRVRFELRYPRLRVESRGEVVWSTASGQCGIRFLDLSPRMTRQIDEWIFGNLLEGMSLRSEGTGAIFIDSRLVESSREFSRLRSSSQTSWRAADGVEEDDGLLISAAPLKVIELAARPQAAPAAYAGVNARAAAPQSAVELDWLSQPLSGRGLAWTVNGLVVVAALLLFALVFLSVAGEAPRWPVAMSVGAALVVAGLYWGFFRIFGGASPGARLARLVGSDSVDEGEPRGSRFR